MSNTRYREVTVGGSPHVMGQQLGEATRAETRGFCAVALERVRKTVDISTDRAMQIARECAGYAQRYRPDLVEELLGMAEGANVPFEQLMLLQVRNQLTPDDAGACTSLSVSLTGQAGAVVAQTWDNDPVLDEFTVVVTRHPEGRPATLCCTQAGLISYMGLSETGMGACVNTLPAPSRDEGVPHYFTLRELLEAEDAESAAESVRRAQRAIPANIMLATPQGPADLEVALDGVHVLYPEEFGCTTDQARGLGHTNHCVHPDLIAHNDEFPELIQSHARSRRIQALLQDCVASMDNAAAPEAKSSLIQGLQRLLQDHEGYPVSICRHANDDPQFGFWETVFALVIDPAERQMYVSRGAPCSHPFERYELQPTP